MRIICRCNLMVTICFLLFWFIEVIKSIFFNSTIINSDIPSTNVIATILLFLLISYIIHSFLIKKIYCCTIVSLLIMSICTIAIFYESIYFYLPWNHNEQFIISECILIYLAFFSLIWLIFNCIIHFVRKHKGRF